jgi:Domain of unknown function (DUF4209)
VIFDDLPGEFETDEIERACDHVTAMEAGSTGTLHMFGGVLVAHGEEIRTEDDQTGLLVIIDGLVCQLWLGDERSVARWGGAALGPMMETANGMFPPPVPAFPASVLPYVEKRAETTGRSDAQARYYDFLWISRRTYLDAREALHAYLRAGVGSDPADVVDHSTAASYLCRAAQIARNLKVERASTAEVLIGEMRRAVGEEGGGFVWSLAQALGALAPEQPTAAAELVDELLAEAEAATAVDPHRARTMLEAAGTVAAAVARHDVVEHTRRLDADLWQREATARAAESPLVELALLREAIRAYQRVGDGPAIQRLKVRYADAASRAADNLKAVRFEFQVPAEQIRQAIERAGERIRSNDVGYLRLPIALQIWPRWEDVRARFRKVRLEDPIEWLVSRFSLTPDGRVSASPDDEEDREDALLLDYFNREVQMMAGLNFHLIEQLRESGDWSANGILANLRQADDELAAASESGIRAFEVGDYWSACHALVPQFERGLRKIALALSANVRRLVADEGLEVATLGPILADEAVIRFLGSDLAQTLVAVFTTPRGLNIRNNTAHGLLAPSEDQRYTALFSLMGILTVGYGLYLLRQGSASRTAGT